jgi:hypothetical protein
MKKSQAPNQSTTSGHSFRHERKKHVWNLSQLAVSEQRHEIDTSRMQAYSGEMNVMSYHLRRLDLKSQRIYRRQTLTSVFIIRMDTTLQNTMHSFFFYNLFQSFVSAIIGKDLNNIKGQVYWGRGLSFTVKTPKCQGSIFKQGK